MKWKALRKHSLHEKTAALVFLKPFISSNEWCHCEYFGELKTMQYNWNNLFKSNVLVLKLYQLQQLYES